MLSLRFRPESVASVVTLRTCRDGAEVGFHFYQSFIRHSALRFQTLDRLTDPSDSAAMYGMIRRARLRALLAVTLIAVAVPARAASVTLRNSTWRPNVTIEVRVGPHQKCDDDPARPPQTVAFGRSVTLNGRVVCVRHDTDPANPTGTWGEWTVYEADIVDDIP